MARRFTDGPTDAELEILNILWQFGPCTVREVFDALNRIRPTGYTTALKLLQIMMDKALVKRDDGQRTHVYEAAVARERVQKTQIASMVDRLFDGSFSQMVLRAIQERRVSPKELETIEKALREHKTKKP